MLLQVLWKFRILVKKVYVSAIIIVCEIESWLLNLAFPCFKNFSPQMFRQISFSKGINNKLLNLLKLTIKTLN